MSNKHFEKKEIDLTKVTVTVLTEHGKSSLLNGFKKILIVTVIGFIFYGVYYTTTTIQKQECDDLLYNWMQKEKDKLYNEWRNSEDYCVSGGATGECPYFSPQISYKKAREIILSINECKPFYDDRGYEKR